MHPPQVERLHVYMLLQETKAAVPSPVAPVPVPPVAASSSAAPSSSGSAEAEGAEKIDEAKEEEKEEDKGLSELSCPRFISHQQVIATALVLPLLVMQSPMPAAAPTLITTAGRKL